MTLCNLTIEGGGRAGMIAPDATTFAYLAGRPFAPRGEAWDAAVAAWTQLHSDAGFRRFAVLSFDFRVFDDDELPGLLIRSAGASDAQRWRSGSARTGLAPLREETNRAAARPSASEIRGRSPVDLPAARA